MNLKQKTIIVVGCALALAAVSFPPATAAMGGDSAISVYEPFHSYADEGRSRWLVEAPMLSLRLLVVFGVTAALALVLGERKQR